MDFGDAIKAVKKGRRVKRIEWGGYWFIPSVVQLTSYTDGDKWGVGGMLKSNPIIIAKLKNGGGYAPAQPYMADMLAEDWVDLDEENN